MLGVIDVSDMELLLEQTELRDSQPGRTRVYGLDLASGKKVWEHEAASPVTSSPAIAKGKVVVATADGQVICFG
jgi:outer membrane protein assembly factor BamB